MNTLRIAFVAASCAFLSSCAYIPPNPDELHRVSPDYMASGSMQDIRAYVYADHTILEFDHAAPAFLLVRDQAGKPVNFEKFGHLYRLDRNLDTFTVWLNGASATFTAVAVTQVFSAPPVAIASSPPATMQATAEPVPVQRTDFDAAALLKLSEAQLAEVRQLLASGSGNPKITGEELQILNARMDAIEAQLLTVASAVVRISFAPGSTAFKPSADAANVLLRSARKAQTVHVHGHTDSRIAGPDDARIALGRALSARKFLVINGIDRHKIGIHSTAAGDFIAPNITATGRTINRRVEFQFADSHIATLESQTSTLAKE